MGSAESRARAVWRIAALAGALVETVAVSAAPCPPGDLLRLDGVRALTSNAERLVGSEFLEEGSDDSSLILEPPLEIDLGQRRTLNALMLQAGHDDLYTVEGSADGESWKLLAVAREVEGGGLRSRAMRLSRPADVRYLRVRAEGGDGSFSISGIRAWCRVPEQPPQPVQSSSSPPRFRPIRLAQFGIALGGLVLFAWGVVLRRAGRPEARRRVRDLTLAGLGLLAALAWWNFGRFHPGLGFVHAWEQFHYFLGGKYFDELGYQRLYPCVAIADAEDGLDPGRNARRVRDMKELPAASILADPDRCKQHFSATRWESFRSDVRWFRGKLPPVLWERIFLDHGYNPPPAWGILGTTLTRHLPASDRSILALALLDPVLLVALFAAVLWAFGWRATCVALLWWGTNRLGQDWLLLSVLGICLMRRKYAFLAGLALGYATLLRIFPGLLVAALVLRVAATSVRARRLAITREQTRFGLGCLVAVSLLLSLTAVTADGLSSWRDFGENVRPMTQTPGPNMVGLMSVLTYEHSSRRAALVEAGVEDPNAVVNKSRGDLAERRRPLHWLLFAGFTLLLALAVRDEPDWSTLVLGIGLIPVGVFVSSYYYGILLGYGLLWRRSGDGVAASLCALSVVSHGIAWVWPAPVHWDTRFAASSLATIVLVLGITGLVLSGRRSEEAR
jgi:hypothetical protein